MPGRKYIDKNDPDLPANMVAIEGRDWISALHKIEREMRFAPVNYGNFLDLSLVNGVDVHPFFMPRTALGDLIIELMNANHLDVGTQGCGSDGDIDRYFSHAFNKVATAGKLDSKDQILLKAFFNYLSAMTKPLLQTWPGRTVASVQLRGNDFALNNPLPAFVNGTVKNDPAWRGLPFFGSTYHVRMSFNTLANAIYDDKTVISAREHEYLTGGLNHYDQLKIKYDKHDDVWHPKPWSVSVLTPNIWPHRPVVQSSPRPMNLAGKQERRVTFSAVVQRF